MKFFSRIAAFSLLMMTMQVNAQKSVLEYVNPIIGTNGMGHTFPGACSPFGIVQLSPETDTIPHNVTRARFTSTVQAISTATKR